MSDQANAMKDALKAMKANYAGARNQMKSFGGEKVPEGEYVARLSNCKFHTSSAGKLSLMRTFSVMEGECQGMAQTDFMSLGNEVGLAIAMQFLDIMGYEIPEEPEAWEPIVVDLKTNMPVVKIKIKHSGDFVNVQVLEVLEDSSTSELEEVEEEEELEGEGDVFDEMDRSALKKELKSRGVDFKVYQSTTDDEIRAALRK